MIWIIGMKGEYWMARLLALISTRGLFERKKAVFEIKKRRAVFELKAYQKRC